MLSKALYWCGTCRGSLLHGQRVWLEPSAGAGFRAIRTSRVTGYYGINAKVENVNAKVENI
ncbi:hypothetical protein, partial [Cupriavidus sp. TA19]|uniref:hypothetical protein n=1 Tax=Cupriavidus sp. TA19 TaxID=701108 RepID=UPI00295E443D